MKGVTRTIAIIRFKNRVIAIFEIYSKNNAYSVLTVSANGKRHKIKRHSENTRDYLQKLAVVFLEKSAMILTERMERARQAGDLQGASALWNKREDILRKIYLIRNQIAQFAETDTDVLKDE